MKNIRPTKEMREYLDEVLKSISDKTKGEPDLYLVSILDVYGYQPKGSPIRIYKNKDQLYRNMDKLVKYFGAENRLGITAGWFDGDEE